MIQFENVIDRLRALPAFYQDKMMSDPEYKEIDTLLRNFAVHILWNTIPASGSTIKEFQGLTIEEILELLPDMEAEKI